MAYVIATQAGEGAQKTPLPGSLHVNRRLGIQKKSYCAAYELVGLLF